jgi:hypothetical protein
VAKITEKQTFSIRADPGGEYSTYHFGQKVNDTALQIQEVEIENASLVGDEEDCLGLRQEERPYFILSRVGKAGFFAA